VILSSSSRMSTNYRSCFILCREDHCSSNPPTHASPRRMRPYLDIPRDHSHKDAQHRTLTSYILPDLAE
jgi:hypothetical protein